jgi:hypothetical protein
MQGAIAEGEGETLIYGHSPGERLAWAMPGAMRRDFFSADQTRACRLYVVQ